MKKIFTLLTAIMLVSALQAQRYKVLNIYKNGKINHTIKLSNIDSLKVAEEEIIPDGHEYVDLGLPSGTLWATYNIGADLPADYGDYFAWGEITSKESYTWSTYKFMEWKWGYGSLTKYCTSSSDGEVDDKVVLEPSDDAATANWGSNWSMPTKEQLDELRNTNNTIWTWETMKNSNGTFVNGCKVVSKSNGNFIFLPAAGYR